MSGAIVRPAAASDAAAVARIYNEGIADRLATFETRPRSVGEVAGWLESELPFLVCERDGSVVAWARVSPYSDRCVYEGVAENSVYVAHGLQGHGIGRALLERLIEGAEQAGIWTIQTGIFPENEISLALHQRCGFRVVGVRVALAQLHGEWRDVVFLERRTAVIT